MEKIKERLDLVDFIKQYLALTKAGSNFRGLCPFHGEKTPSFFVSPSRQLWRCFGCNKGGDIFHFLMELEGVDFKEALKTLADRAGIQLRPEPPHLREERSRLLEASKLAAEFFRQNLNKDLAVKKYLIKERSISPEALEAFAVGYSPAEWRGLYSFLRRHGFSDADLLKAGLIIRSEGSSMGGFYDRFRNRVMFPVFDLSGRIVGFSGRIFEPREQRTQAHVPKYLNSPATPIYDKSRLLFGLQQARSSIRRAKYAILVEGNIDVVMSWQAGTRNTIAPLGTALHQHHLGLLRRFTQNVKIAFDADQAGREATLASITPILKEGFGVKIITLKDAKDPADLIKRSVKGWINSLKGAQDFIEWLFDYVTTVFDPSSADGKVRITKTILPYVKILANKVEQGHWISVLSDKLSVSESFLTDALAEAKPPDLTLTISSRADDSSGSAAQGRADQSAPPDNYQKLAATLAEALLAIAITNRKKLAAEIKQVDLKLFEQPEHKKLWRWLKNSPSLDQTKLDSELRKFLSGILLSGQDLSYETHESPRLDFKNCLVALRRHRLQKEIEVVQDTVKKAESDNNQKLVKKNLSRLNDLLVQIAQLDLDTNNQTTI